MKKLTFLLSLLLALSVGATSTGSPTGSPVVSPTSNLTSLPWAGVVASVFIPFGGAHLDGSNDYITRGAGLDGIADGDELTFAILYRINVSDITSAMRFESSTGNATLIDFNADETVSVWIENSAGTTIIKAETTTTTVLEAYAIVLFSVKLSATATMHLYLDDVDRLSTTTLIQGETMDFTVAEWTVGAKTNGNNKVTMDINAFGMWRNYHDFSNESERRKFFNASGNWAIDNSNTSDGIIDGVTPDMWFAGEFGQWHTNKGSGGGFTVTGALSEPAT